MGYEEREIVWAEELKTVSLILQVNYDDAEARESLRTVGYRLQANSRGKDQVSQTLLASLLVGLNCVASAEYGKGELWPKIMKAMNFANTQPNQAMVGELFRLGLEKYKLARFETPQRNLGEIMVHAGVPLVSLDKYMARLLREYGEFADITGEGFNSRIRDLAESEVQAKSLDMPIWRFLEQAGEIADDFTDKCIEIIDDLQDGEYDEGGGLGLPDRVINRVVEIIKERKTRGVLSRKSRDGIRLEKPKFRWHEIGTGNELRLELPQLENKLRRTIRWSIEAEARTSTIYTNPSIAGGRALGSYYQAREPSPQFKLTAEIVAGDSHQNTDYFWSVPFYREGEWLLVFDEFGNHVPGSTPLQPGVYVVLYPARIGQFETEIVISGESDVSEVPPPSGWSPTLASQGWTAAKVDLFNASKITLKAGEEKSRRLVSSQRKPKLVFDEQIVHAVFSEFGDQVLSGLPSVVLPPSHDIEAFWTLQIRDDERNVIHLATHRASEDASTIDLNLDFGGDLDGRYDVSIAEKALGSAVRQQFVIVRGLTAESFPNMRRLKSQKRGLETCTIVLQRGTSAHEISLNSETASLTTFISEISTMPLRVKPEYEAIELYNRVSGNRSEWFTTALCHIEDLSNVEMTTRLFESKELRVAAVWSNGAVHQLFPKQIGISGLVQLSELSDDAEVNGAFVVTVGRTGQDPFPALSCFNKKLLQGFTFDDAANELELELAGGSIPKNLVAAFYSDFAPWIAPEVVSIDETKVSVPYSISALGDFHFVLEISDPWAPTQFSGAYEPSSNSGGVRCEGDENDASQDALLASWFRSGVATSAPENVDLVLVWKLMLLGYAKSPKLQRSEVQAFARKQLSAKKSEAIGAFPITVESKSNYLTLLFEAGLIDALGDGNEGKLHASLNSPFLATLYKGSSLGASELEEYLGLVGREWGLSLPKTADLESEEATFQPEQMLKVVEQKAHLLSYAPTPMFAHPFAVNTELLNAFLEEKNMPPGRFFEAGTLARQFGMLAENAPRLLDTFSKNLVQDLSNQLGSFESDMPLAYQKLAAVRPLLSDEVVAKVPGAVGAVINLPGISLRLALIARLAARKHERAKNLWPQVEGFYKKVQESVKGLAEHDLVLAEIYIQIESSKE